MKTERNGAVTTSVSVEPRLLARAKRRAKERRRSLSAHVCDLLHADLSVARMDAVETKQAA